uniref:Uncharacterized protein n=1 Tax=viral metagenome TaxID=1070528 RepID=A0A6C0KWX7_9ZZZZ
MKKVSRSKKKNGGEPISDYIFISKNISTQSNTDQTYEEIGIVHVTDSAGINVISNSITNVSNFFGSKGYDNPIFDKTRNDL